MKILDNMESCYGCGACFNACPTEAIEMKENTEGFLEPAVDEEKCISCGRCRQVCPSLNCQYPNESEPDIYAFSAEEKVLYNSSSGGMFTFLAEHILKAGGHVVGVAYDDKFHVNHIIIHNIEEIDRIRRSKYLQSSTESTYKEVKTLLEEGESVLYSGCPCQIAGLLRFLGKDYEKLYTVDVLCHGVPSPGLFQEHLRNTYGDVENIEDVEFRSREGWSVLFRVKFRNGDIKTLYGNKSVYMQSFLQDINLRASCFQCQYSRLPRQGDITIGDLWAAANLNLSFEFRKGVSVVLLNNDKGTSLFQDVLSKSEYKFFTQKLCGNGKDKPCDTRLLNRNIFQPTVCNNNIVKQQKFFDDCTEMKFESAVYASLHKFDVGLMLFMSNNYGSIATNYALYRAVNDMGKKAAVMDHLCFMGSEAIKFARGYMDLCGGFMDKDDWQAADQCFETFVVGSDMSWNWSMSQFDRFLQFMLLGFASENKRMISFAPSFGPRRGIDEDARTVYSYHLKRFDAISVREDYGVEMCRDLFGIQAKQVIDPVFLCDRKVWDELSSKSQLGFDEEYVLAYILDITPYKRQAVLEAAKNLNKKPVVILDLYGNFEANKRAMNMDENVVRPEFVDWVAYFRHASCVITDSFHGVCFSVIYGKKFVAIKNRAKERFDSLAKLIEYPSLFFEDSRQLLGKTNIFTEIDYDFVYKRIEAKRMESEQWLRSALNAEVKSKSGNDSTRLMLQLLKSLRERMDLLNKVRADYAYEEEQKREIVSQLKAGKTWLDIVLSKNNIVSTNSKLREINNLRDYFAMLKSDSKYVAVLSGRDECATHRGKFLEASGLPLRTDVQWRNSYVAVIDGGAVKVDEKSTKELNFSYEFVAGHPNYSVEYLDNKLKVCCAPLQYCKIKIKSRGFTESPGRDRSEIIVDNIDYSMNKIGLNIVVIDKETGGVIDSININTYSDMGLKINRV